MTVVGTFFNMVVTTAAAYGLSKTELPGHRIMMWFVIMPMLFSAGLLPTYMLIKDIGLLNSVWVMVVMGLVSPFNLILLRNFFWSIPTEVEEAARLDGASVVGVGDRDGVSHACLRFQRRGARRRPVYRAGQRPRFAVTALRSASTRDFTLDA